MRSRTRWALAIAAAVLIGTLPAATLLGQVAAGHGSPSAPNPVRQDVEMAYTMPALFPLPLHTRVLVGIEYWLPGLLQHWYPSMTRDIRLAFTW